MGIYTWVSVEPVIDPNEALSVMRALLDCVDLWKVGKLNHFKEAESRVDWRQFLIDTQKTLVGKNVYIKKDLLAYATKPLLPLTFLPENK